MAYTRVILLFVLTLLQLCRAAISDNNNNENLPEWYSANVINEGFQPKPISEIFSTEPPFSSTNPIVILPKLIMPEKPISSTIPPSSIAEDSEDLTKMTILPLSSTTPLPPYTVPPQSSSDFSSRFPSQTPQVEITQFTEQTQPSSQSQFNTYQTQRQTTPSISSFTLAQRTTLVQDPSSSTTGQLVTLQNEFPTSQQQQISQSPQPTPDFIVVYQKIPTPEGFPVPGSQQGGIFDQAPFQQSSTSPVTGTTVLIQPTTSPSPQTSRTASNNSVTTSSSERPTTRGVRVSRGPVTSKPTTGRSVTQSIRTIRAYVNGTFPNGPLRIRVVAPRGSITNVNINPPIQSHITTTKRPTPTRTHKAPKPKKNTYEACLNGCRARRNPICAIPLSATWIDPENLKGFPSVCHMACFNSYKKEPYEKILDGRCGRLKTRILSFDSKTKLTRQELKQASYVVDNDEQTIVEFSPLRR